MSNQLDATIAKRLDITVKQGQTFKGRIIVTDIDGLPVNLTGSTIKLSVRETACGCDIGCADQAFGDTNAAFRQDFNPSIIDGNQITFNENVLLGQGLYKYDMLIKWPNNRKEYLLYGNFKVKKSYTSI